MPLVGHPGENVQRRVGAGVGTLADDAGVAAGDACDLDQARSAAKLPVRNLLSIGGNLWTQERDVLLCRADGGNAPARQVVPPQSVDGR